MQKHTHTNTQTYMWLYDKMALDLVHTILKLNGERDNNNSHFRLYNFRPSTLLSLPQHSSHYIPFEWTLWSWIVYCYFVSFISNCSLLLWKFWNCILKSVRRNDVLFFPLVHLEIEFFFVIYMNFEWFTREYPNDEQLNACNLITIDFKSAICKFAQRDVSVYRPFKKKPKTDAESAWEREREKKSETFKLTVICSIRKRYKAMLYVYRVNNGSEFTEAIFISMHFNWRFSSLYFLSVN